MDIHTAIVAAVIIDCGDGGFVKKACFFVMVTNPEKHAGQHRDMQSTVERLF